MNAHFQAAQTPRANRRRFLASCGAVALAGGLSPWAGMGAAGQPRIRLGACDWSLGKLADPAAFEVARAVGLDGVQVSLGTLGDDMHLRLPEVQRRYREAAAAAGLGILSLAIGELNNIPYKSDARTIPWVADAIDVCVALGCRVILLAFFGNDDLRGDAAGISETVRRLREVAAKAEKAGVVLGLETWLSAEDNLRIVERVGSRAVKVYYDVANSTERGYDIHKEIRWLGRQGQICEFHFKENGCLLGRGAIDFPRVCDALREIGYEGNVQIEGAVPPGGGLVASYVQNRTFLRKILPG